MAKRELAKTLPANKAAGKVQVVKEWIDLNYDIKINIFDHSKSYIVSKERVVICFQNCIFVLTATAFL